MSETPLVNIHTLRRDIYIMSAFLLASKSIANINLLENLGDDHYEGELNRLFIMVATATRQLLDNNDSATISNIASTACGTKIIGDNPNTLLSLNFRGACNAIIHAVEIIPYIVPKNDSSLSRKVYAGTIIVHSKQKQTINRAELAGDKFVEYCILLTNLFLES